MELLNDKGSSRRGSSNSNFSEIGPALCQLCSMSLWLLFTVDVTRDPQALNESHQRAPAKAGSLAVDALCLASGTNTHALRLLCTQHSCQTQAWRHRFPTRSRLDSGFDQTLTECKELQAYVTLLLSPNPEHSWQNRERSFARHAGRRWTKHHQDHEPRTTSLASVVLEESRFCLSM